MKKQRYNYSNNIKSLKQIHYEKARIMLEMIELEEDIQETTHHLLQGGLFQSLGLGWSMFTSAGKWLILIKAVKKGWKWIHFFLHKFKKRH